MNIVIGSVIGSDELKWIERKSVAAMVVDRLDGRASEKPHGLANGHAGDKISDSSTESVKKESFNWMVVKSSVRVGDIETVVAGMEHG